MTSRDLLLALERESCRTRGARSQTLRLLREQALEYPDITPADVEAALKRGAEAGRDLGLFQERLARFAWDDRAEAPAQRLRASDATAPLVDDAWQERLATIERELTGYGADAASKAAWIMDLWASAIPARRAEMQLAVHRGLAASDVWQDLLDRLEKGPGDPTVRALLQRARNWPAALPAFDPIVNALRSPDKREPLRDRIAERVAAMLEEASGIPEPETANRNGSEQSKGTNRRRRHRSSQQHLTIGHHLHPSPTSRAGSLKEPMSEAGSSRLGAGRSRRPSGPHPNASERPEMVTPNRRQRLAGYRIAASARPLSAGAEPPCAVWELPSAETFYVLLDETGSVFDATLGDAPEADRGRAVAIVFGGDNRPPALPRMFHATSTGGDRAARLDRHMRDLFARRTSVFGLSAGPWMQLAEASWHGLIMQTVGWTLRCLPIEQTREVWVLVEERSRAASGVDWDAAQSLLHAQLTQANPAWKNLRLVLRVVSKQHDPALGYADLIAYSWRSMHDHTAHARASRQRMQDWGLPGRHLLEGDLPADWVLLPTWHDHPERMNAHEWTALMAHVAREGSDSVWGHVLARLLQVVKENQDFASTLVSWVAERIARAGTHDAQLQQELAWIRQADIQVAEEGQRLVLATAELQLDALSGVHDSAHLERLLRLESSLRDEFPGNACRAGLAMARLFMERLEWDKAIEVLTPWLGDALTAGLRLRTRAHRLAGQAHGSARRWKQAQAHFERAVALAARLSRAVDRSDERHPAAVELALLNMRVPHASEATRRAAVEPLLALNPASLAALACDDEPEMRDLQLVAARYLMYSSDMTLLHTYVDEAHRWADGTGTRWALIEWCRAWLFLRVGDKPRAVERWELGVHLMRGMEQPSPLDELMHLLIARTAQAHGSRLDAPAMPENMSPALRLAWERILAQKPLVATLAGTAKLWDSLIPLGWL